MNCINGLFGATANRLNQIQGTPFNTSQYKQQYNLTAISSNFGFFQYLCLQNTMTQICLNNITYNNSKKRGIQYNRLNLLICHTKSQIKHRETYHCRVSIKLCYKAHNKLIINQNINTFKQIIYLQNQRRFCRNFLNMIRQKLDNELFQKQQTRIQERDQRQEEKTCYINF
ncbi:unnamed protein product [Paramecium sonneborni]|uniref:Uncharacterized protein n=1 Tax=Paramecium sonneborni TaxID=65129 RepID=A0A8S1QVT5_9CILI|nr:unnamed protein product [Paramecium sonneborni]